MDEHTSGPWEAEVDQMGCKNVYSPRLRAEGDDGGIFTGGCGTKIGFTHGRFPESEDAANAYLIAAAPELLRVCEELVAAVGTNRPLHYTTHAIELAIAAIAKAKGE